MGMREERTPLPRARRRIVLAAGVALLVVLLVSPLLGSTRLDVIGIWRAPLDWSRNPAAAVFFVARLPRVLLAALAGAGLAICGVVFQALLRNPLASPYTLGVTSGAALGAFIGMRFGPGAGSLLLPLCALTGALLATLAAFLLAMRGGRMPPMVLLLAGVVLNYSVGAVILLLQYFADATETARMVRWMMGDVGGVPYTVLALLAAGLLPGGMLLLRQGRALNLLSLGEEEALAQGIPAGRVTLLCLLVAAWITGLLVAVTGPIGFVGIIVPHAVRLVSGADNRIVLPAALLVGATFLILCDTLARTVLSPVELPVGVLTASLGGPFFLALLVRQRRELA
jgi:iron complex transport system permease protein